ncbi:MAG: hypothetical protein HY211_06140 [Candidatus Omnitrophica bacterium]|nr:hypothetical protein [Candidatus Omnitrophota bacterium]
MTIFVENLTFKSWLTAVLPRLRRGGRCLFIYSTPTARVLTRFSDRFLGTETRLFEFRLIDVRDEKGQLLRWRITYQDLAEVQQEILNDPRFRFLLEGPLNQGRLPTFFAKDLGTISLSDRKTLWRVLLTIQICVWKSRRDRIEGPILVMERRPWFDIHQRYASRFGLRLIPASPYQRGNLRQTLKRWLGPGGVVLKRFVRRSSSLSMTLEGGNDNKSGPKLAVEYYGHLNLRQPECYSDLFFWHRSALSGQDLLVLFGVLDDPLNSKKWEEITSLGISALVTHPKATRISEAPIFIPRVRWTPHRLERDLLASLPRSREGQWMKREIRHYLCQRAFWEDLFAQQKVKLFIAWYKYDGAHCAIADALESLGGVTAIYQRAYEVHPSAETTVAVDLVFGFSPQGVELERRCSSKIRYYVTTGYVGDYRFPLLKEGSQKIRQQLQGHGARRILAFTDESSAGDSRWHSGHEFQRENYAFLLTKVLQEPWFGLTIKPKAPVSLRRRLGPTARLLEEAEATGRCFVYEGESLHGSAPVAAAALAADALIHGHLCAGTAGMESALAGVPTLMLDREGWPPSPLYRLGEGQVVFKDWDLFWKVLVEHWTRPGGVPGFGDWSPILEELDPFRDGRAAERIGMYLSWLLEGFKAGLSRETVMADAANRYAQRWGRDKVTQVDGKALLSPVPAEIPVRSGV